MTNTEDFVKAAERLAAAWPTAKRAEQALRELGKAFGQLRQDVEALKRPAPQESDG